MIKCFKRYPIFKNFIYWALCITLHSFFAKFAYSKGMSIGLLRVAPLYDLIQDVTPNLQPYRNIPEILHIIPIAILVCYILFFWNKTGSACLSEFFVKHGTLMFVRGICFSVTLLPDSSQMCSLSNHFGSCFDLIFSGHSTIMLLCTLLLVKYFPLNIVWKNILFGNVFLTSILIVLCRNHYTIDVIISLLLTYFVYKY